MIQEKDFQFCPACGGNLDKKQSNLLVCEKCNLHYYINPKPTNAIIIENELGEVLLVKRAIDPKKGMLDLPGGFIDIDETLEESMTREIKEELGISMVDFKYYNSFYDEYEHGKISSRSLCMVFLGKINSQEKITPGDDAATCKFYKKESIPFEKMAFKNMRAVLENYCRKI